MSNNHLSIDKRGIILLMHQDRENVMTIAKVLNRNKGTISRELCRNRGEYGYNAHEALSSYRMRRVTCRSGLKVLKMEIHEHIVLGLEDHKSQTLRESIRSSQQGLPCMSLTVDNGKEFAAHKETSVDLDAPIYFCHPHSPWEKPNN